MAKYPDSTVFSPNGEIVHAPKIRKVFLMGGPDSKIHQHECLYEGKAGFEKLHDHVIFAQITIDENNERKAQDIHKDKEHTPTGLPSDFLVPREKLMFTNKLWRYLTSFRFEDLINSEQLYYCRLDNFWDNLEGTAPESCVEAIRNDPQKNQQQKEESIRLFNVRMENSRKCGFACCWHMNDNINLKMWEEYGESAINSPSGTGLIFGAGLHLEQVYRPVPYRYLS